MHSPDAGGLGALAPVGRAVRRNWWLVLACTVLAGGAAGLLTSKRERTYKASTQVLVTPVNDAGSYAGLPVLTNSVEPTRILQTAASILESQAAARGVSAALGRDPESRFAMSAEEVGAAVTVDALGDSNIVTIVAKSRDPRQAGVLADLYARTALAVRGRTLRAAVKSSVNDLRRRRPSVGTDSAAAAEVARELTDLQRIVDGQDPNFSLLNLAGPAVATGASPKVVVALGLIGGVLLGLLGAVAIESVNRRVRDESELLTIYPLPVLTRIGVLPAASRRSTRPDAVPANVRESLRTLKVQLDDDRFLRRAIMLTSPSPGDGKTTTAINFAYALAGTGAQVILLDLDLRKSELGARLGLQVDMVDLCKQGPVEALLLDVPGAPGVRVLSGRVTKEAAPLFEAIMRRIPQIVAEAKELADYIVIDTAPLGVVADALAVAGVVDDVILVVRPGRTDRNGMRRTRELLDRLHRTPTGFAIIGADGVQDSEAYRYVYEAKVAPTPESGAQATKAAQVPTGDGRRG